jgi:hypothetical protein
MDEIRFRLRVSNLEARFALSAIEAAALSMEISSPLTTERRREETIECRDTADCTGLSVAARLAHNLHHAAKEVTDACTYTDNAKPASLNLSRGPGRPVNSPGSTLPLQCLCMIAATRPLRVATPLVA